MMEMGTSNEEHHDLHNDAASFVRPKKAKRKGRCGVEFVAPTKMIVVIKKCKQRRSFPLP